MKRILFFAFVFLMGSHSFSQSRADFYWSGGSPTSDNIDQGDNWYTSGNPASGDNLYFDNTVNRHWAYSNYGGGSYFGNIITYDGAGGIRWYGDNTYALKFENFSDANLLELSPSSATVGSREIGNRIDNDLEINPVGSGGILVSCDRISIDNLNGARTLKIYGDNLLTIDGYIYEKNGTGAQLQLLGSATVIIKSNSTYTGATTLASGILELQGGIASSDVIVQSGATLKINGDDITIASLTVNSGGIVNVEPGKSLTVSGNYSNSGTVTLHSDASGTASLIVNGSVTGDVTVEKYLATETEWNYMAESVNAGTSFDDAFGANDPTELYEWDESFTNGTIGWWLDLTDELTSSDFEPAKGYAMSYYVAPKANTYTLTGAPYTSDQSITLTKTANSTGEGWNLVGNPFTATLAGNSAAQTTNNFLDENAGVLDDTYTAMYFWNEGNGDYDAVDNASGATYIDVGRAFMVLTDANNSTLNFNESIRKHADNIVMKGALSDPFFELQVTDNDKLINEIEFVFIDGMTKGLDPSYDAGKFQGNPDIAFYSFLTETNDTKFDIQALPPLTEGYSVPIGLRVANAGNYTFKVKTLINFDPGTPITLEDRLTGELTDLTVIPEYNFTVSEAGTFDDRFVLHFKSSVGIPEGVAESNPTIAIQNQQLSISDLQPGNVDLRIIDIMGRVVATESLNAQDGQVSLPIHLNSGIYILEINTDYHTFAHKISVK